MTTADRTSGADIQVEQLASTKLLELYGTILHELNHRKVVRTRNAPAGDLAETLTALVYDGKLAINSEKAWDVLAATHKKVQVKALVKAEGKRSGNFSVFRSSGGFDVCVFVLFSPTYAVTSAIEVPAACVKAASTEVKWVNGWRIGAGVQLSNLPGSKDLTDEYQEALRKIDALTANGLVLEVATVERSADLK